MGSSTNITHYGIIGMGPIGTTIAAHLKKAGCRVSVLCYDQEKLDTLNKNAVSIEGVLQANVHFDENYLELKKFLDAKPQVILIATKSVDSPELLKKIAAARPDPKTIYVACQNGLDVENRIIDVFGSPHALRMVLNIGCKFTSPSNIYVNFSYTHFLSLRKDVDISITKQIADHLTSVGFKTEAREDYQTEVMKKAILNASMNTLAALTGQTMKSILEDPELHKLIEDLVREGIVVGQAMGLKIPAEFHDEALRYMAGGGDHKPSMLTDIESKRRTENEDHCGRILYYSKKHGVPVPTTETIYYLLKNLERKTCS